MAPDTLPDSHGVSPFARYAEASLAKGYSVIPTRSRRKRAELDVDWRNACWTRYAPAEIRAHAARFPDAGMGLACGRFTVAIDLDSDNPKVIDYLRALAEDICGQTPLLRMGKPPRLTLIYRCVEPIVTVRLPKIDMQGLGTMVVAYGVHPDTGGAYRWIGEGAPHDTALDELPGVTCRQCEELAAAILTGVLADKAPRMSFDIDTALLVHEIGSRTRMLRHFLRSLIRGKASERKMFRRLVSNDDVEPFTGGLVIRPKFKDARAEADFEQAMRTGSFL